MKTVSLAAVIAALGLLATTDAAAHAGKLDSYGCHHDAKAHDYHCHKGKDAGRKFKSQEQAIARPRATEPKPKKKSTENVTSGD